MRCAAAWVLGAVLLCVLNHPCRAESPPAEPAFTAKAVLDGPLPTAVDLDVTDEPQQVVAAPMPQAFWQGLFCLALVMAAWRMCRVAVTR